MHSVRNLALAFLFVAAAASAVWLLSDDSDRDAPISPTNAKPHEAPARAAPTDVQQPRPPLAPVEHPTPESVPRPVSNSAPAVAPKPAPKPAADPAEDLYPEHLDIAEASWHDVLVTEILRDVAGRGNFVIDIPSNIEKILDGKRMSLDLTKTTGALVLARVLQPYGLTYTAREGKVRLLTDQDD